MLLRLAGGAELEDLRTFPLGDNRGGVDIRLRREPSTGCI